MNLDREIIMKYPESHEYFMELALKEAKKAYQKGEVPVGAIIVLDGQVIAKAHNNRESKQNPIGHAEMLAIIKASKKIGSWRLENASLYVTLEPCAMCAGAIIQSRIKNVYYGALDLKSGAVSSIINLFEYPFNHKPNMVGGIKDEQSSQLLKDFFKNLRK